MKYVEVTFPLTKIAEKYRFAIVTEDGNGESDDFMMVFEDRGEWDRKVEELRKDGTPFISFSR
jgi:hypothetical protein